MAEFMFRSGVDGAVWPKPDGPVRLWASLRKMTISKTCNAFFIITTKSQNWLTLTAFIIVNFTITIVGRPP